MIGFDPKIGPEHFKSPFTAAEGWGTYEQKLTPGKAWSATISVAQGALALKEVRLPWLLPGARVRLGADAVPAVSGNGVVRFDTQVQVGAGAELVIEGAV